MMTARMRESDNRSSMRQAEFAETAGNRAEKIGSLTRGKHNASLKLVYDISKILGTTVEALVSVDEVF